MVANIVYILCCDGESFCCEGLVFGAAKLILDFEDRESGGTIVATVRKRRVSVYVMFIFFLTAVFVMICCFMTFWAIFMLDETFACDNGLDCFAFNKDSGDIVSDSPLGINCSEFESQDNITITCYAFVFRYAEGIGAAGGIIVFAAFILKAYAIAFFWALDSQPGEGTWGQVHHCCKVCVILLIGFSPLLLSIGLLAVSIFGVPIVIRTLTKTTSGTVQFAAYIITLSYITTVGVYGLSKVAQSPRVVDTESANGSHAETQPRHSGRTVVVVLDGRRPTERTPLV